MDVQTERLTMEKDSLDEQKETMVNLKLNIIILILLSLYLAHM